MKNYYVIKTDEDSFLYEKKDYEKVQQYMKENPQAILKGFYDIEYAEKFYNKKNPTFYYIVKQGKTPGIYTTRKELVEQVKDFPDALVKKTRDYKIAQKYNEMTLEEFKLELEEKKEKEEKKKLKKEKRDQNRASIRDNFKIKERYIGFIDCEANNRQAISIGIVIYDTYENSIVDKFYTLIRPYNFTKLDSYIEKLTKLTTEEIKKAPYMKKVLPVILDLLNKYGIMRLYSWGGDDKKYITSYNKYINMDEFANKIKNIQKTISSVVYSTFHNDCLGLANMKKIYHLDTEKVSHNALDDTIDLANVFHCWILKKEPDVNVEF